MKKLYAVSLLNQEYYENTMMTLRNNLKNCDKYDFINFGAMTQRQKLPKLAQTLNLFKVILKNHKLKRR